MDFLYLWLSRPSRVPYSSYLKLVEKRLETGWLEPLPLIDNQSLVRSNSAFLWRLGWCDEDSLGRYGRLAAKCGALLDLAKLPAQPELVGNAVVEQNAVANR